MYGHERSLVKKLVDKPFALVGVNTDEDLEAIRKTVKEKNLIWRSFWDGADGPISRSYGIEAFPTIILIDHNGIIQKINPRDLDGAIEELVSLASGA